MHSFASPFFVPWCWRQLELPTTREPRGGGSDDSYSGFGTNVWASHWLWPSHSAIPPHRDRRWPASRPSRRRSGRPSLPSRSSSNCRSTKSLAGRGLTASPASGRRNGSSGTPWSRVSRPSCRCRCSQMLEQLVGVLQFYDALFACCRAGYRRAQDHLPGHPVAYPASRNAAGGTVGGSGHRACFRRADRWHSSSVWWWASRRTSRSEFQDSRVLWRSSRFFPRTGFRWRSPYSKFSHFSPAQKKCEGHRAIERESATALQHIQAERSSSGSSPGWAGDHLARRQWGRVDAGEVGTRRRLAQPHHVAHPVAPTAWEHQPCWGPPPAWGSIQILGKAVAGLLLAFGCGRPCDHAAQVPSSPCRSTMGWCLRFRSSTDSSTSSNAAEKCTHSANWAENQWSRRAVLGGRGPAFLRTSGVQTVQKTVEFPHLHSCGRPCAHAATSVFFFFFERSSRRPTVVGCRGLPGDLPPLSRLRCITITAVDIDTFEHTSATTTTTTTTTTQQQPTTNNQQPTTNNQQPTTNNQQPTTNNQQPTTNNKQQTTNNKQQTTNNKQQTTTTTIQSGEAPF